MTRYVRHRCTRSGKVRYAGKTEAQIMADIVTAKNRKIRHPHPEVVPYACDHCMGWHVGHPPGTGKRPT